MASVSSHIKGTISSDNATGALYIALLAFVFADLVPTPGDAWTFIWQTNLRNDWKSGTITAAQYWRGDVAAYYLPNIIWWILVFFIIINIPGSGQKKFYVAAGIIGAGIIVGVVYNLYKKDAIAQALQEEALNPVPKP